MDAFNSYLDELIRINTVNSYLEELIRINTKMDANSCFEEPIGINNNTTDATSCLEELEEIIGKNKKSFVQAWDEMKENNELDSALKNLVSHFLTDKIESWNLEPAEKKMFSECLRKGLENWIEKKNKSFVQACDEMKENNELDSALKNLVSHFLTNNIESWNLEPAEKKMFSGCLRKGLENWVGNRILLLRTSLCGEGNDFLIGLVLANVPLMG